MVEHDFVRGLGDSFIFLSFLYFLNLIDRGRHSFGLHKNLSKIIFNDFRIYKKKIWIFVSSSDKLNIENMIC